MARSGSGRSALLTIALVLLTAACHGNGASPESTVIATGSAPVPRGVIPVRLAPAETIHVDNPQGLVIAGGSIWTVSESLDAVDRIDIQTHRLRTIPLGAGFSPQSVMATAGSLWVPGVGGIARVDPSTGKVTVPVRDTLVKWLASGFGSLWASGADGTFQVDPRSGSIVKKIGPPCAVSQSGVKAWAVVSVGGGSVWVSCGRKVERIDPATGQTIATVSHLGRLLPGTVTQVLAAGENLWLMKGRDQFAVKNPANTFSTLERIDPSTNELVPGSTIHLVKGASSPGPVSIGDQIWFPISVGVGQDVGMLFEFDATTGRIVKTFDLSQDKGYGNATVAFAYGSMWTVSYADSQIGRWMLPTS